MFRTHQEYRIKADSTQASLLNKDVFEDKQIVGEIKTQIGKATYLYPR